MAIIFYSGFETGDFGEWSSVVGSPAVVETQKKTGDYAMRCNTSATTAYVGETASAAPSITFYLYIASNPSTETMIAGGPSGSEYMNLRLTTDRYLKWYDGTTLKQTGLTQLDLETWYRISGDSAGVKNVWINGIQEMSDPSSWTYGAYGRYLGVLTNSNNDLYFDDYVRDSSISGDLGDIRVLRASPNAAGQYAEFDTVSGYTNCDEVPANDADFADDSGVSVLHRECYNLQDCATMGLGGSDTIQAVNVWVRGYDSNGAQGIFVRDNSVDYKTLTAWGKAFKWKNKLYATNAPRGSAWTQGIFDAFQSGGYSEGSKDVYMSCVMVMVAFLVGAPAAYYHGLKVQGVGELALCDVGTHPLRIRKGGTTYGIELVATDDPNASALRIKTPSGIKAIRKYT